jgi:hypothetical protein
MKPFLLVSALAAFGNSATPQDIEAMAKWTSYQIVHYKVVGEFSGEATVLTGSGRTAITAMRANLTDRIEVEFDWDQQEFTLVGKPVIRNFPTKLGSFVSPLLGPNLNAKACPAPKMAGAPELVTGLSVKNDEALRMSGYVTLEVRRELPGGSYPSFGDTDTCGEVWETSKPVNETTAMTLMAVPGMYLAMPTADGGMKISADKTSIIMPPGNKGASNYGWTWTYTPTGVK